MTDQEVLELLNKIDDGYKPTEVEKQELAGIECITWKEIKKIPKCIDILTGVRKLKVSGDLINIPGSIVNLWNLQSLDLSFTQIKALPDNIGLLTNLQYLKLSFTQIHELPESIGNLSSLQILYMFETPISSLPESLWNLTSLQSLDLGDTQIRELPESVAKLKSLQNLFLSNRQIRELPESIGNLPSLQKLYLNSPQLSKLPDSIGNLTRLQILDLRTSQINSLPESIGNLTNLQSLDLRGIPINSLPESIGNLTNLQSLYLRDTPINSLPESIGNLTNLKSLDLSKTQIHELPESIVNLSSLKKLNLSSMPISEVPKNICTLPELNELGLEDLTLSVLPEELLNLNLKYKNSRYLNRKLESGIFIHGLRLQKQPVSVFFQPREIIKKYYDSYKVELKESKVIFMGDGGAGKSYTIQRIKNNGMLLRNDTEVTHDITVEHWDNSAHFVDYDGTIDFWDFGGQDIYLSMHRCFLTERSCYVIVLCNRQYGSHRGLMRQARYWLKNISAYSKKSPILIAINTWSGQPRDGISLTQLRNEFPDLNIVDQIVYNAHAPEVEEFKRLLSGICRITEANYSYSLQFPTSWNNIRNRLLTEYSSENLLAETEYYRICREEMEKNDGYYEEKVARWLLQWFNDLGYCFNYHDIDDEADGEEYHVLKPQWVIRAMYKIINYEIRRPSGDSMPSAGELPQKLAKRRNMEGRISKEDIVELLTDGQKDEELYSERDAEYIIRVLIKFGLAYLLREQEIEELFIPALCSDLRPDDFDVVDSSFVLKMEYLVRFKYLPETVLQHLMIKCYQNGRRLKKVWKYGFHIQVRKGLIAVEMHNDTEIEIRYYEPEGNNDSYGLHEMRDWLGETYKELGIENVRDFIIQKNIEPQQTAIISVTALIAAYRANPAIELFYAQDDDVYVGYSVDELLGGLYGSNYKQLLLGDDKINEERRGASESKNPEDLSGKVVTDELLRQIVSLLQEINNKKPSADSEDINSAAQQIITAMKEIHIDDIAEKVRDQELMKELISAGQKGDVDKVRKILSDSNTTATFFSNLAKFGKYAALFL